MTSVDSPAEDVRGTFTPDSWSDAERRYDDLGSTAQVVVRSVAKAMEFDREEYERRVGDDIVETARQALFAETLEVRVADVDAFDSWRSEYAHDTHVTGSDSVENVAWHVSTPAETAVAATFENESEAAVGTVRRMAFNRLYRERLTGEPL